MPPPDDHALAAGLAEQAGQLLLGLRAAGGDPDTLRDAGDRRSHEFLMAELARERPADSVLSEEGADDKERLAAGRVWIVDPLDGTREFGEPGRTDWAVHVALWTWDASRRLGGPGGGRGGAARAGQGAVDGRPAGPAGAGGPAGAPAAHGGQPHRASQLVKDVAARIGAELVPCGSAGAKAAS